MPIVSGNISGSIRSIAYNIPSTVKWFSVQDKSGAGATVRLAIVVSGREIYFKTIVLAANASSGELVDIRLLANSQILIVTSAEIDYYFSLDPVIFE